MKDSSIELIKKHFCLDDSKLEKGSNVIGFSEQLKKEKITDENRPDAIIYDFAELKELFPKCPTLAQNRIRRV